MTRDDFRRAYRAARWTLHNRPLADLEIARPRGPDARRIILVVLAMGGQFQPLQAKKAAISVGFTLQHYDTIG